MERKRVFTGATWEKRTGYCRAIRVGSSNFVSGTAPVADDGTTFAPGDGYRQTRRCFDIVERALRELGATLADVVRSRMYVTDVGRFEEFARAHGEIFGAYPPATAMVEIKALVSPDMLIEVEADAIVDR